MRHFGFALAAAFFLFLFGCGEKPVMGTPPKQFMVMRSVVSLSPSTTELFGVKFPSVQILGRTASCNHPANIMGAPVVLNGVKPNFEMIVNSKAAAVLYDPALFSESDLVKLKDAGMVLVPIGETTVRGLVKRLYEVGSTFALETSMMGYIGDLERAEASAVGAKPAKAPRVAVMMPDARGAHMIAGTNSFVADVVRTCGGEPVGPESAKFEPASIEALVGLNPELIACTPKYNFLTNDPRLASVEAVKGFKAGKPTIAELNADIMLRQGARVNVLINNLSNFISGKMGQQ